MCQGSGSKGSCRGVVALALGALCLTGCQLGGRTPRGSVLSSGEQDVPLAGRQVADVQVAVGHTLERRGDPAKAEQVYRKALEHDPGRGEACLRLAVLLHQRGEFAQASSWYEKARKFQPNNPDVYCNLGYSLYLQQRWTEAEKNLRRAIALKPDHRRAQNNLGLVLARTGRREEALAAFGRGGCGEGESHANVAFARALEGDLEESRALYENAMVLAASSEQVRQGRDQVVALSGAVGTGSGDPIRRAVNLGGPEPKVPVPLVTGLPLHYRAAYVDEAFPGGPLQAGWK